MTNYKKIGLTALAGSLVASSAMAGALDISGAAKFLMFQQMKLKAQVIHIL